jgi:hypothetical protein
VEYDIGVEEEGKEESVKRESETTIFDHFRRR